MEHYSHLLLRSYQLVKQSHNGLPAHASVAEEPAEYHTDSSRQCNPGTDSNALTDHQRREQIRHPDMALADGVQVTATDRQTSVEQPSSPTQRAAGRKIDRNGTPCFPPDETADDTTNTDETANTGETDDALIERLKHLVSAHDRNLAEQLTLYLEIDQRELWRKVGCRDCMHWMDRELGISRNAAYERLRAARALCSLPVTESLFALGKLGWSKVRELTRIATPANEQELASAALELSASETVQLCQRWRHADTEPDTEQHTASHDEREAAQALQAWRNRSLRWRSLPDSHNTRITIDLPADSAAEFLKALEGIEELDASQTTEALNGELHEHQPATDITARTPVQRRADALLLMSTKALAHAGPAVATSERYRVLVTIDSRMLDADAGAHPTAPGELPPERPAILGFGPIAVATARRLASQARLTIVATNSEGEVVSTGRDTRLFSPSTFRALIARDRCCQMPGCTQNRTGWLRAHHVLPWAQGGDSTLSNAALLCSSCHVRLHEGGLKLEQVDKRSVALPDDELLSLTIEKQDIARAKLAAIQRFRLLRGDGSWVAGPRRCDQAAHQAAHQATDHFRCGDNGQNGLSHRANPGAAQTSPHQAASQAARR